MNALIGVSDLMMKTHLTREQQEYANMIRDSASALLDIVNDILDFSKVEGRQGATRTLRFGFSPGRRRSGRTFGREGTPEKIVVDDIHSTAAGTLSARRSNSTETNHFELG